MAENSKIEWTHHTASLWWGCIEVHTGCDNCYAAVLSNRWGKKLWGKGAPRQVIKKAFDDLEKYQNKAAAAGEVHRVFVGSMMDIFEKPMPVIDGNGKRLGFTTGDIRESFFNNITQGMYPNLMFLLLTKRPSNINKYIPEQWKENPPKNVMFGTSPVDQETFDKLVKQLLAVNGLRFLSMEPQIDKIDVTLNLKVKQLTGIHWLIQGGESGHHKRPFSLEWARYIREVCRAIGIPYFFKQIDKIQAIPEDLLVREHYHNF